MVLDPNKIKVQLPLVEEEEEKVAFEELAGPAREEIAALLGPPGAEAPPLTRQEKIANIELQVAKARAETARIAKEAEALKAFPLPEIPEVPTAVDITEVGEFKVEDVPVTDLDAYKAIDHIATLTAALPGLREKIEKQELTMQEMYETFQAQIAEYDREEEYKEAYEYMGIDLKQGFATLAELGTQSVSIRTELDALRLEERAEIDAIRGRAGIGMGYMGSVVNRIRESYARTRADMSAELAGLQMQSAVLQNNLNLAKSFATDLVAASVWEYEQTWRQFGLFMDVNREVLDELKGEYKDYLDLSLQYAEDVYLEEKAERQQIVDWAMNPLSARHFFGLNLSTLSYDDAVDIMRVVAVEIERKAIVETGEPGGASLTLPGGTITYEQLSPIAKAIVDGTAKMTDITPTMREKIIPELNAYGYSRIVSAEIRKDISEIVNGMDAIIEQRKKIPGKYKGYAQGWITEKLRLELIVPEIQTFIAATKVVGMILTRLFEKGRISDQDRIFYLSIMPNLRQTPESAQASADELKRLLTIKGGELTKGMDAGPVTPLPPLEPGRIRVMLKTTGETGHIPEKEFDPKIYEKIFPGATWQEIPLSSFVEAGESESILKNLK